MVDNYQENKVWNAIWILPCAVSAMCYLLIPRYYVNMQIGKATVVFVVFLILLLVFTCLFYSMFYSIAHASVESHRIQRECDIMTMQEKGYRSLLENMKENSRLRHDFRHQLIVISGLLNKKDYVHLEEYVNNYVSSAPPAAARYVSSAPLNALFAYYEEQCRRQNIRTVLLLDIPEDVSISDIDLCVIFGNLLENAFYACKDMNDPCITVKAAQTSPYTLALSVTNPYSGVIIKEGQKYMSTRHSGAGQGLESVKLTADKYGGAFNASFDSHCFTARVLLHL